MSPLPAQTTRKELIARLRAMGFDGPFAGTGKHPEFMQRGAQTVRLPNKHSQKSDIGRTLLANILRNAGITTIEWEQAG
ncbi:hypothetical protein BOH66_11340 [Microbacterium aurum]|uniref:Type II toxin-antitoxin system HicA family toxin n=2 Tax=Microbacterium aurum TaxID=36805 RepID=A0A1P8U9J4_9MICO|nr:hypothetical protein BOH66_11340 [Microbacterium aurum]